MSPAVKLIKSSYSVYHLIILGCFLFILCFGLLLLFAWCGFGFCGISIMGAFHLCLHVFCGVLMNLGLDFDSASCGDFPLVVCCFNEFWVGVTLGVVKFEFWLK